VLQDVLSMFLNVDNVANVQWETVPDDRTSHTKFWIII